MNIGGFDPENLISSKKESVKLSGYVGCIRGLKIDDFVVSFSSLGLANSSFNTSKEKGSPLFKEIIIKVHYFNF